LFPRLAGSAQWAQRRTEAASLRPASLRARNSSQPHRAWYRCMGFGGKRQLDWITIGPDHVWIMFGSCLDHVWIMFGSCLDHAWIMFGSCLDHAWIMFGSYQLPNGVFLTILIIFLHVHTIRSGAAPVRTPAFTFHSSFYFLTNLLRFLEGATLSAAELLPSI
jgi:hypothetical protein